MDEEINYYPEISEGDYPSFVALPVTGINPTYAEWIAQQRQANLERSRVGQTPVAVPVRLADFIAFCDGSNRRGYVAQYLLHYAMERGPRR
jgi:hypothetical protein